MPFLTFAIKRWSWMDTRIYLLHFLFFFSQYYCSNHFFIDLVCLEDIENPLPPPFPSLANVIATIVTVLQICPISTPLIQLLFPGIIFHRNVGLDVWSKLQRTPREFWYLTAETLVTLDNIVQTVAPDVTNFGCILEDQFPIDEEAAF